MYIYTEHDIKQIDKQADQNGLSVNALMETAGRSLYFAIKKHLKPDQSIVILSGKGNNGGDGIVLARYLQQNGYQADLVFPFGEPMSQTAKQHFSYYKSLGYTHHGTLDPEKRYDVIIDALLGVGARLPLNNEYVELIHWCNEQVALKIAIDLPTGVLADTGEAETAFKAEFTYCLHGVKCSAFDLPSSQYYGKVDVVDIGLPHDTKWKTWSSMDVKNTITDRSKFSHKGTFGTGLLIAGTDEMPGCALLAGKGAMKMGVGKLVIATSRNVTQMIVGQLPEATYWNDGVEKLAKGEKLNGIKAVAIGPGLTDYSFIDKALQQLWSEEIPIIIDAGALVRRDYPKRKGPIVITPHPGEFSRITGIPVEEIQRNRLHYASTYAVENGVIVVLKGANTVIAYPDGTGVINVTGNAALAKGGSGDTLTGMLLGMLCSEPNAYSTVANAVYLHGLCADLLVKEKNNRTIQASDLTQIVGRAINLVLQ